MIKREELKKGDRVLIVPNSYYTRDTSCYNAQVTAVGPKFITVAYLYSDNELGRTVKFNNDERMSEKDYSSNKLFLGTKEEYEEFKTMEKKASELYYEIKNQLNRNLSYKKLLAIKTIIEAEPVDASTIKTLCEIL